jgi:aspartate aminotransferase
MSGITRTAQREAEGGAGGRLRSVRRARNPGEKTRAARRRPAVRPRRGSPAVSPGTPISAGSARLGQAARGASTRPRTPPAPSLRTVPGSRIRELGEIALGMDGVLRLYFGESNLSTPAYIVDSAIRALREGRTFYSENAGLPTLRRAIAAQYLRLHGIELDPGSEIVVSASGLQALHLAIRSVIDPGDEAIVLSPAWPNGSSIIALSHGIPREVPLVLDGERYELDFDALEAAASPRTRLVLLTSPSNPLGWVASVSEQRRLLEFCRERGIWLIADEVYERIYFEAGEIGAPAPSILRLCDRDDAVQVVQSFSKTYCMTGWRVGWLVTRSDIGPLLARMNEFFVSHAATFAQVAAETALEEGEDEVRRMIRSFRDNRDFCVQALRELPGVTVPRPDGAFYLFPRIGGLDDSFEFCRRLLLRERVGLAPGSAFGLGGEGSIRLCYAAERSILEPALERLDRFVRAGG